MAVQALFDAMESEAKVLGGLIVEKESELDRAFATREIDKGKLRVQVAEIARLEGELRLVHLATHLEMRGILSDAQIEAYDRLRGYSVAEGGGTMRHRDGMEHDSR